jgi:hypothetical protein
VKVCAANAGTIHADEDIVDSDYRFRHVLQPEPTLGFAFDKGFHAKAFIFRELRIFPSIVRSPASGSPLPEQGVDGISD